MSVASVNERLAAQTAAGTSIWLDQMSRGMIESGDLARMVEEESLRGVTSNPAIFEKSILGTSDYDEALAEATREGLSARETYRRLAVADVQAACDVLPLHRRDRQLHRGELDRDRIVHLSGHELRRHQERAVRGGRRLPHRRRRHGCSRQRQRPQHRDRAHRGHHSADR
jgi:hypothetical protein